MEKLCTEAEAEIKGHLKKAKAAEKEIISKRRFHILPKEEGLQKISRYEAHLSREMYKALHELEALQARRNGGSAPLARIDLQLPKHLEKKWEGMKLFRSFGVDGGWSG